jgi:hypothetical protein
MSKKRVRLNQEKCTILEIEYRGKDAGGQHKKYWLSEGQLKILELTSVSTKTETKPNDYKQSDPDGRVVVMSSWIEKEERNMGMEEYCKKYNLPFDEITSYKFINHTGTPYYNIVFKTISQKIAEDLTEEFIAESIRKHIIPLGTKKIVAGDPSNIKKADRVIYTDVHVGMDTNKDATALYPVVWNENVLMDRMNEMVDYIIRKKNSEILILDELGDLLDGWNAQTTRGGHSLPQNMDNKKAFDVALKFKVEMIHRLVPHYDFIMCNNVCEDNHAGAFGYVVNSAFKQIVELQFANIVYVTNHERFINHYSFHDHTFVISHGKDSKSLKFGFKPHLDPKQIEKIDGYMKQNKLYNGNQIEFSKGDSHQLVFDMASSDDFDYMNYPAFSPSSEWVQTNFKKGRSGFVLQHIEGDIKTTTPYWFKD